MNRNYRMEARLDDEEISPTGGMQVAMADTRDPDKVKISVGYEVRNGQTVKITGYASGRETIRPVKILPGKQ